MIGRIYTRGSVSSLASYLDAPKSPHLPGIDAPESRVVAVRPWALGLEAALETDWVETDTERREVFRRSIAALKAISRTRPDLRHRVAHITLSVDPLQSLERGSAQTRRDYLHVFRSVAAATGLSQRCGVLVLHSDGHSGVKRQAAEPLEHLHAIVVLADPDTGRSIPLHVIRRRVRAVCKTAAAKATTVADRSFLKAHQKPHPIHAVLTQEIVQRTPPRRQRSWEIDL